MYSVFDSLGFCEFRRIFLLQDNVKYQKPCLLNLHPNRIRDARDTRDFDN